MLCHEHRPDTSGMTDLILSSYAVYRKVYVNRDEIQQIARLITFFHFLPFFRCVTFLLLTTEHFSAASMLRHNQETNDKPQTLRVGSLVVRSLGQLLPHQLQSFHSRDSVYPVISHACSRLVEVTGFIQAELRLVSDIRDTRVSNRLLYIMLAFFRAF